MKNLKCKLLFIFNVMIMAFLLGMSLFNEKPVKAESNEVTISFENTEGGDETFSYFFAQVGFYWDILQVWIATGQAACVGAGL